MHTYEERYTRVDHNHLTSVVTVDDPKIYTKPFTLSKNEYRWIPDQEAEEQMCVPSEMIQYMNLISKPAFGSKSGAMRLCITATVFVLAAVLVFSSAARA